MPGHDAEYRAAVDSMIADMEKTGKGLGNPELIRILAENSGAAYDWMTSLGVTWLPDPYEALGGLVPPKLPHKFRERGLRLYLRREPAAA